MEETLYTWFIRKEQEDENTTNMISNIVELTSDDCCFMIHIKYSYSFQLRDNNLNNTSSPQQITQTISLFSSQQSQLIPSQHIISTPTLLSNILEEYDLPEPLVNHIVLGFINFAKSIIDNKALDRLGSHKMVVPVSLCIDAVTPFSDVGEFERVIREIHMESIKALLKKVDIESNNTSVIDKCSICLENYLSDEGKVLTCHREIVSTPCSHVFHRDCIVPWLEKSRSCPLCRCTML